MIGKQDIGNYEIGIRLLDIDRPTILVAVRSNSVAPSSVQMALTSMVLPTPWGPAIRMDLMWLVFSRSWAEPMGRTQYSLIILLMSPGHQ